MGDPAQKRLRDCRPAARPSRRAANAKPVVVDLCCGMGGLSLAASQLGMRVVVGTDISPTALRTFQKNFGSAEAIQGSVLSPKVLDSCAESLKPWRLQGAPLLVVSGPPCQGFSAAGTRDAGDPRNRILGAVARAIVKLKPDCAIVENVSTLLTKKHARRVATFNKVLRDAGYSVCHVLLDAVDFGVAQKRRRAFFLITRQKLDEDAVVKAVRRLRRKKKTVRAALAGLPKPAVRPDIYDDTQEFGSVSNHFAMRHSPKVKEKIAAIRPGTGPMSYRRLHASRPSNTIFSGHRAPPSHFSQARSITVREAARLQGLPDTFRIYGSFANQMEQVTNAVPPPLARAVLLVLIRLSGVRIA
jgi:DNA (cytosine-5)-methyltransferase 1